MNHFGFYAQGRDFDVDAYVARSPLPVTRVWHRGQPQCGVPAPTTYATSGFAIELGDGASLPLAEQERIAEEFLRSRAVAVKALVATPGVTFVNLGLHDRLPSPTARVLAVSPVPTLMEWGPRTGVAVTVHVDLTPLDGA